MNVPICIPVYPPVYTYTQGSATPQTLHTRERMWCDTDECVTAAAAAAAAGTDGGYSHVVGGGCGRQWSLLHEACAQGDCPLVHSLLQQQHGGAFSALLWFSSSLNVAVPVVVVVVVVVCTGPLCCVWCSLLLLRLTPHERPCALRAREDMCACSLAEMCPCWRVCQPAGCISLFACASLHARGYEWVHGHHGAQCVMCVCCCGVVCRCSLVHEHVGVRMCTHPCVHLRPSEWSVCGSTKTNLCGGCRGVLVFILVCQECRRTCVRDLQWPC